MSCKNQNAGEQAVSLTTDDFGSYKDECGQTKTVKRFTWTNNDSKICVQAINYGATITAIKMPSKDGRIKDITTGFGTIEEYRGPKHVQYYGATIGRVTNRIAKGKMTIEGVEYCLAINNNGNHLHGGIKGFNRVLWDYFVRGNKVIMTYYSADMEENYPGHLLTSIKFELKANEFVTDYKATVSKACPVNLTNHAYFNLGGHGSGAEELYKHEFTINADKYTEVDQYSIPTGKLLPVSGTAFDLRVPQVLGGVINKVPNSPGYDHNYCVSKGSSQSVGFIAKAYHPPSGRAMEIYSNQPGVQFYTGNFMPEDDSSQGKGACYKKHGAFCFETQMYPDAVHHKHFPDVILCPGQEYHNFTSYKFLVQK